MNFCSMHTLTSGQRGIWFAQSLNPEATYYNLAQYIELRGAVDPHKFEEAIRRTIEEIPALRSVFVSTTNGPRQRFPAEVCWDLPFIDLTTRDDPHSAAIEWMKIDKSKVFDLERGPPFRYALFKLAERTFYWYEVNHHIINDVLGASLVDRRVAAHYRQLVGGECFESEKLLSCVARLAEDEAYLASDAYDRDQHYWREQLTDRPPVATLSDRPPGRSEAVIETHGCIPKSTVQALKNLGGTSNTSLATTVIAVTAAYLSRMTGSSDLIVGIPVSGRINPKLRRLVGLMSNVVPLRLEIDGAASPTELLSRTGQKIRGALRHQRYEFGAFRSGLGLLATDGALHGTTINFVPMDEDFDFAGIPIRKHYLGNSRVEDLIIEFHARQDDDIPVKFIGNAEHYDAATLKGHQERCLQFMRCVVADPDRAIGEHIMLLPAERQVLLGEWGRGEDAVAPAVLPALFEAQASRTPDALAIECGEQRLSYAQVNQSANQLAHRLIGAGIGPESLVGLCIERSPEMVIALLAVLKAGGAYLPLDPRYPRSRLEFMLADARPALLLVGDGMETRLPPSAIPQLSIDLASLDGYHAANPGDAERSSPLSVHHPAYVIYTSGSTGQPKGVVVTHAGIANLAAAQVERLAVTANARVLQFASLNFDASLWEVVMALVHGAALIIPPPDALSGPPLRALLAQRCITHVLLPPSVLATIDPGEDLSLEALVVGGEACPEALAARWSAQCRMVNAYGPSESTVCATMSAPLDGRSVSIGTPITGMRVYVLDAALEPVPVGVIGELYIAGDGLARGYLNRLELTAERFLTDPHGPPGSRMYRSGDRARWRPDGSLEFMGRVDQQVKIRGFRIEPGEIEAVLRDQHDIAQAVVVARDDHPAGAYLAAYMVPTPGARIEPALLRQRLAEHLPDYMVPATFTAIDALPLTSNGKLDRKALPSPASENNRAVSHEPPSGPVEIAIAEIWCQLLNVDRVGRNDSFFELGGHSLLAVSLIERLGRRGWAAQIQTIFNQPTVASLAAAVGTDHQTIEAPPNLIGDDCTRIVPELLPLVKLTQSEIDAIVATVPGGCPNIKDIYPLAPLQEGILIHHQMGPDRDPYVLRSLFAFDERERLDQFLAALQAVIDRHDVLRTAVVWEGVPEPVQVVWREATLPIQDILAGSDDPAGELWMLADGQDGRIDVRKAPMLRATIAHDVAQGRWLVMLLAHHLTIDHTTLERAIAELRAHLAGETHLTLEPRSFRSFIAEARESTRSGEHEAFFRQMLGDVEDITAPFGHLDVRDGGSDSSEATLALESDLAERLRAQVRLRGVVPASLFHLAWSIVVARTSGRDDVVFGTVMFGRMHRAAQIDQAFGLFINTLPIRFTLDATPVAQSLRATQARLAELLEHEHAPLSLAQGCSAVPAGTTLFTALLNYRYSDRVSEATSEPQLFSQRIKLLRTKERSNYPFALSVDDVGDGFSLTAQTADPIDPHQVCQLMRNAVENLVLALEQTPDAPLRGLPVLLPEERQVLLGEWGRGEDAVAPAVLPALFEAQASRTPDALAIECGEQRLSYAQVNQSANQLAHRLIGAGIGPESLVGLCIERSPEMVIALLAVLKAGGAYLPLDPRYPRSRLEFMLADARPALLLVGDGMETRLPPSAIPQLSIDLASLDGYHAANPGDAERSSPLSVHHPAYVIYTSGSTGQPKGVVVTHAGIANLAAAQVERLAVTANARVLQFASLNFDASLWEVVMALVHGAALIIPPPDALSGPPVRALRAQRRITHATLPPSVLATIDPGEDLSLEALVVGGEACPEALAARWSAQCRMVNAYGPSESTVCATMSAPLDGRSVSIGTPITGMRVYVLDAALEPVPVGIIGELYIAGDGLARGYLNRPKLTAERFLTDPRGPPGSRMYRSGDRARWRPDGSLEFMGRVDQQVKIRGFRIEPGEIEAVLRDQHDIAQAVVIARDDHPAGAYLAAYMVPTPGARIEPALLRQRLAEHLPDYMVPATFTAIDALPLTSNGKLDRKALPSPASEGDHKLEDAAPLPEKIGRASCRER